MKFSKSQKAFIPKGVATFLPEGTARRRAIEREILSLFSRWKYQEVTTPIFEYLDIFSLGVGEEFLNRAYKFVDRATGRMMVLRPDVTPQIARIAATLLADRPLPMRLCYSANVFRHEDEHAGREREIFQMGAELIGPSDAASDAEIIELAIETLRRLGLMSFKVILGQMEYTRGILQPLESSPALFKQALALIARKEASPLADLLRSEKIPPRLCQRILSLLSLFGGEEILKKASADTAPLRLGLKRIREIYAKLRRSGYADYLLVDLGEVRGLDYYTGTIFELYADGVGTTLGGGGRYDDLLAKFGSPHPSTGFALNIERIEEALEKI